MSSASISGPAALQPLGRANFSTRIEAAAQSVADVYAARPAAAKELVRDPRVLETARVAAEELARENGGRGVEQVQLSCMGDRIEARLVLNGYSHHAGFRAPECSPP